MKTSMRYIVVILCVFLLSCSDENALTTVEDGELSLETISLITPNEFVWVPRESLLSRNGQSMGYGAKLNTDSDKLIIFLDGGGACFNGLTCSFNLDSFSETDFYNRLNSETSLLINQNSDQNQFAEWNFIFVPYATGDVHSGSVNQVNISNDGPENQSMVGANNLSLILNNLSAYFGAVNPLSEVVLAGSSAGAFGVLANYVQVKETIAGNIPTTCIVDAGQLFLDSNLLTPCLENQWQNSWNLNANLPDDIDNVVLGNNDYDIQKMYEYASIKYPEDNFGLLSYYEDSVNSFFYGFGQNNCQYPPSGPLSGSMFRDGVMDIHQNLLINLENWKVFYKEGSTHIFLSDAEFDQEINGVTLNMWLTDLREGIANDLLE